MTRIDQFSEQGAGPVFGVGEAVVQNFHDVEADVNTNQVRKCKRTHWVSHSQFHYAIDGFGSAYAFHQTERCFIDHGHQYSVGYETRVVVDLNGFLSEPLG